MPDRPLVLIMGMALVTFIPRFIPLLLFSKLEVSPAIRRWLTFVPVSVFAALIASDIFFWQGEFSLNPVLNLSLFPSALVLLTALKTRSLLWSMTVGVTVMALLSVI